MYPGTSDRIHESLHIYVSWADASMIVMPILAQISMGERTDFTRVAMAAYFLRDMYHVSCILMIPFYPVTDFRGTAYPQSPWALRHGVTSFAWFYL